MADYDSRGEWKPGDAGSEDAEFTLWPATYVLLVLGVALIGWIKWQELDWSAQGISTSLGNVTGAVAVIVAIPFIVAYATWWLAGRVPGAGNIVFLFLVVILVFGQFMNSRNRSQAQFYTSLEAAAKQTQQRAMDGNSTVMQRMKPLETVLDQQASSGGPNAAGARVASQVLREIQTLATQVSNEVIKARQLPRLTPQGPGDTATYDKYIDQYQAVAAAADAEAQYMQKLPQHVDQLIANAGELDATSEKFLQGFRIGAVSKQGMLLTYNEKVKAWAEFSGQYYQLMKDNNGHWSRDAQGLAVFDDPAKQTEFGQLVSQAQASLKEAAQMEVQLTRQAGQ